MQIDDSTDAPHARLKDQTRREILAILSESGLSPAQGIEAMIERFLPGDAER